MRGERGKARLKESAGGKMQAERLRGQGGIQVGRKKTHLKNARIQKKKASYFRHTRSTMKKAEERRKS